MSRPRVALAIPAYNEADGVAGFLSEVDRALAPLCESVTMFVIDDHSTDGTGQALTALSPQLNASLELISNERNRGHGPSLMTAYRRALESKPDYVLQVDGDGQFHGTDLRRVLVLLMDDAYAVCGVRRFRQDPWFRMAMTALLRSYLGRAFAVRARDANWPFASHCASGPAWSSSRPAAPPPRRRYASPSAPSHKFVALAPTGDNAHAVVEIRRPEAIG